jgi:hypothetical protein
MKRMAKNPLWILGAVFLAGVAFTLLVVWTLRPTTGDIEPIELEPPSFMGIPTLNCLRDGLKGEAWFECMGVGYKSSRKTIEPEDGEITQVSAKFVIFDSEKALQYALKTRGGCRDCDTTEGISNCKRDLLANTAHCLIMVVRPKKVDDNATRVIGHEVMHGIYGRYHNE